MIYGRLALYLASSIILGCSTNDQPNTIEPLPANIATVISDRTAFPYDDSITREPITITYQLHTDLADGYLEIANADMPARLRLPELTRGRHTIEIPIGTKLAGFLPTFTCGFEIGAGITQMGESITSGDSTDESMYDYTPPPLRDDDVAHHDDAAAFRGDEQGITSFRFPLSNNGWREEARLPEIEIRGVGFTDGTAVRCYRGTNPELTAFTEMRNVKTVSTLSHDQQSAIPELRAGVFTIPWLIAANPNEMRIVGRTRS